MSTEAPVEVVLRASVLNGADHVTGEPADEGRGWCVPAFGCALDVPPSGAMLVDCPACEPTRTQPRPITG